MWKSWVGAAALVCAPALCAAQEASLVLRHGRVWTEDPARPEAESIAILGNRILAVGADADVRAHIGRTTRVVELRGRRVTPGFNDSHVHFLYGGLMLIGVKLDQARSREQFRDLLAEYAKTRQPGDWIEKGNWDHQNWPGATLPDRALVDAVTPDNPVLVNRIDGHMYLANSRALKLAGIDRHTPDPVGGVIERDAAGEPTGILKDAAVDLVQRVIPPPGTATLDAAMDAAMAEAARHGVTSVQNMAEDDVDPTGERDLREFQRYATKGKLTVRIYASRGLAHVDAFADLGLEKGFGSDRLRTGVLKSFADGAIGSMTAWMYRPFEGTANAGLPSASLADPAAMQARFQAADRAGLQVATHAIGDRAISRVLDLYEAVEQADGAKDRRFRIEHVQHLAPADAPRFARLGVIASMQPYHAIDDGRWAEKVLGHERSRTSYAWRTLLDAGAELAFGSDWPVAPLDPIMGLYAAATRATLDGQRPQGWIPEQRITVREALHAYTVGSARAEFQEGAKGSLAPGKLADLVVLSGDVLALPPAELAKVQVDLTVFDGQVLYRR
jgi:predicted amidohydrolase YtcJ